MCVCVSWRIKLRIIETHDRIPYKLLDKGLGIFFLFIPTPTPLSLLFPLKQASSFDPTLHHERHLCQRLCLSPTPRSILFFSLLSFKTSSPHCLIAGSVLLCFSQHEKKPPKKKHPHGGEEMHPAQTKRAGKRGNGLLRSLCHSLSDSIIRIFPSSHSGSTTTSRFISPIFFYGQILNLATVVEAHTIWTLYNLAQTSNSIRFKETNSQVCPNEVSCQATWCTDALMHGCQHVFAEELAPSCTNSLLEHPFPDCIRNNQRGRLNIYELHAELVRIQSRLSP